MRPFALLAPILVLCGFVLVTTLEARASEVRLVDLAFPNQALAQDWLSQHAVAGEVVGEDRYGRPLITGAQEVALRDGVAVIYAFGPVDAAWRAAEAEARAAGRGVWAQGALVIPVAQADRYVGEFHVVEGVVTRVYKARDATYINFGSNWRTDFSIAISGRGRRAFRDLLTQITPGTRLEARGVLIQENGPMLRPLRPEQLVLLAP